MAPLDPMSDPGDSHHDGQEHDSNGAQTNGAASANGTLAKIGSQLPSTSTLNWSYGPPPRPEILSAKPNPVELVHAMRRRWPLALGLGITCASIVAAVLWFVIPVKYEAFVLVRIKGAPEAILQKRHTGPDEFALYKATQKQMITTDFVLRKVVNSPDIGRLSSVQAHPDDPIDWLKGELMVDFPGDTEVMRVAIRTKSKNDSLKIVEEVVNAYMVEIVEKEKQTQLENEKKLADAYEKQAREYTKKYDQLVELERSQQTSGSEQAQLRKKMAMEELNMLVADRRLIMELLNQNAMETTLLETHLAHQKTADTPDAMVDRHLEQIPEIARLNEQLAATRDYLGQVQGVAANDGSTAYIENLRREILRLEESIHELKVQHRPKVVELFHQGTPQSSSTVLLTPEQLAQQKTFLETRLGDVEEKITAKTTEVASLDRFSTDVAARQEELATMRLFKSQLSAELERINIERLAPPRIEALQGGEAALQGGGDAVRKYIAIAFSFLLTFTVIVLGVAVLEFQARKVNSVKEVNDGLGIRVVGELPNIGGRAFRRVRGGKGQNVLKALMAERIDGTRTALIHTTAIDPPRVVMITSAEPHEGKTTTSTQLAASLARSGRRTLLIDADIRSPGVHRVFEMPQDPGLCELLRHEADREAVIHPTRTANLWLIPAGRCDLRSVQALSGSYLGSTIAALSVQFDYVIIDAGPVLKVADPLLVGQHVDATVLSVLKDVSKVPNVYEAVERLRSVGITVLGSVVNGVKDDVARHGMELLMAETPRQEPATTGADA